METQKLNKKANCKLYTQRCSPYPHKKIILSTYCIVQQKLTACLITPTATVNCVSKTVLEA